MKLQILSRIIWVMICLCLSGGSENTGRVAGKTLDQNLIQPHLAVAGDWNDKEEGIAFNLDSKAMNDVGSFSAISLDSGLFLPIIDKSAYFKPTTGWWTNPRVMAFSQPLFHSMAVPPGYAINTPEYYLKFYQVAGVNLASWNDVKWVPNWRTAYATITKTLHDRGMKVVGTLSMMTHIQEDGAVQTLTPAILRDPYGNAVTENNEYLVSTLHPAFQNYMLSTLKAFIDAGMDGVLVDELAYGSIFLPDFNANTMLEFRNYMLETYSDEELAELGEPYGIDDFTTLDYAAVVRQSLPPDRTRITREEWTWDLWHTLPLNDQYQRFVRVKNHKFADWLITKTQEYGIQQYRRYVPFSANLNGMSSPEALHLIKLLDFVDLEYFYKSQGYFPLGRALTSVKLAQACGKTPNLLTGYWDTDGDIAARGIALSTNLFRVMIAEAYATGASFAVEEDLHGIKQDINNLGGYYRFPIDHPTLFTGVRPVSGQVGLIHLYEGLANYDHTDMRGLGQMLADSGVQFDIVVGAEEFTILGKLPLFPAPNIPLTLSNLNQYPLILFPEISDITPNHARTVLEYVKSGGTLIVFATEDA